jgi:hypothetical protein
MSLKDTEKFLEDLLLRYDPGVDLSEGSRARVEVVDPILRRIGIDPIDEDIHTFIRDRIRQTHPDLVTSEVDEITDLVIDPMRVIIEPLVREVKLVRLRASLNNTESLADDEVDSLLGNFFEPRKGGGYAQGQVRIYFAAPQSASLSLLHYASTRGGLKFLPSRPQAITLEQMLLNVEGSEYYFDVNYTSEQRGNDYNVEAGEIVSIANLPGASRIKNLRKMRDGVQRETSTEFVTRVQSSQGDRTMNTSPGITAVLSEAFPELRRIFTVGFRDPEMRRDVVTGGGYSTVLPDDAYGPLYSATGIAEDDGDGDLTTPILFDSVGYFVSRIGAAGPAAGWYITLIYDIAGPATEFAEVEVLEVIDDTRIKVAHEFPSFPAVANPVRWILRQKRLEISNIPGGIVLPNGPGGGLIITPDAVHIGGKTDIYAASSAVDDASATIDALGDESPYASGLSASTLALSTDVTLVDIDPDLVAGVAVGMSLVLDEGSDVGSYRVLRIVTTSPLVLQLDSPMTGTQVGLVWRLVDIIDVTLTDPVSPKLEGPDLVTSAGNPLVVTTSGTSFTDAGVLRDDTLEIMGGPLAGRYTITNVSAVQLEVSPAPTLSQAALAYRIYRRGEAVNTPVVRIKTISLLDSAGAPTGVAVPYKHPVLVESRAFQNEASGPQFDGLALLGLVSDVFTTIAATIPDPAPSLTLELRDASALWTAGTIIVIPVSGSPAVVAGQIDTAISAYGRAYAAGGRVFIVTQKHVTVTAITSVPTAAMGWLPGFTNTTLRSQVLREDFSIRGIREGDVVEIVSGPQANTRSRVASIRVASPTRHYLVLAEGPVAEYSPTLLNPATDVRVRVGRPSVGSARAYFLAPTTAEFPYLTARFVSTTGLEYRPDPANTRIVFPAQPASELPRSGSAVSAGLEFTDAGADFITSAIAVGDVLEVLYVPINGNVVGGLLPPPIAVGGLTLVIRVGTGPWVVISFPAPMVRQAVADYINTRLGAQIADIYEPVTPGIFQLRLQSDSRLEIDDAASTAYSLLLNTATPNSDSGNQGSYTVVAVAPLNNATKLTVTPAFAVSENGIRYTVSRYTQRASTTDMALKQDASGLYYADVELISTAPGDQFNIAAGVVFEPSGYYSEGYELYPENDVLSFSTAEVLKARMSRSILLDGSPDAPAERVQLSQQNILVSYDRSQLIEDAQGFCDSNYNRVVNNEALVRHLLPHYVRLAWKYVGGATELEMKRAIEAYLEALEAGDLLEIGDLSNELRKRGAVSVYNEDTSSSTGRAAPLAVIIYHEEGRRIRAQIVRDFVDTTRAQRYIAESIAVTRISTGGIR